VTDLIDRPVGGLRVAFLNYTFKKCVASVGQPNNVPSLAAGIKVIRVYKAGKDHPNIELKTPGVTLFNERGKGNRSWNFSYGILETLPEKWQAGTDVVLWVLNQRL
jgi:hypothetical protein